MTEFHMVWIAQCEAARAIRTRWGAQEAIGYLTGGEAGGVHAGGGAGSGMARAAPMFVAEIKRLFSPEEIREYLDEIRRVGPLGHVLTDEQFDEFRTAGAVEDDPVGDAEDVLRVERARGLLLGEVTDARDFCPAGDCRAGGP